MISFKSDFSKNILTLMTGTAVAQAIPLAMAPILTRLYTPDDFGILAIYMSLATVITVIVSFKYEVAIIIPEKDEDSANLTILSIGIATCISLLLLVCVLFFNEDIADLLTDNDENVAELAKWLYFIPLSVFLMGIFNALSFWYNRKMDFKKMATSKVANSVGNIGGQVVLGAAKITPQGLLIGFVIGRLIAVWYLLRLFLKHKEPVFGKVSRTGMIAMMKRYQRFPAYTLPAEAINVISNQLPIMVIGKFFGGGVLGNYALVERILSAPISLLGRSVLDVFKQKASEDYIQQGNCESIFVKTFKTLALLSLLPTLLLFFLSPYVFSFVFGKEWQMAGDFTQILAVLFFFKFISSPLSYMFNIAEKQHLDMLWQIGLFIVTIISFYIGVKKEDIKLALICFTAAYSFMYIINLYLSYSFSKGSTSRT
ncbi:MAG: lipopolysaccharide biosynthesis protein [Flavobacteriaceae bacterium]